MPGVGVASGLHICACVAVVDSQVQRYHRVTTIHILLCEGIRSDGILREILFVGTEMSRAG